MSSTSRNDVKKNDNSESTPNPHFVKLLQNAEASRILYGYMSPSKSFHHFPINRQYSSVAPASSNPRPFNHLPPQGYRTVKDTKKKMFSQRAFNGFVFCVRIFILILAIVSMILILRAPGACFTRYLNGQSISREICPGQNSILQMNSDRWSDALHFQGRGQNVYGQVALICITLAFALITIGVTLTTNSMLTQILISGLSMVAFIFSGLVESWYATGYDHMEFFIQAVGNGVFSGCAGIPGCHIQFLVKGWAVAAAFYFLGALLYAIDMVMIFISREK